MIASLVLLATLGGPAGAQTPRWTFPVTDGEVDAVALSGNTLHLGGWFSRVGPATGCGVPVIRFYLPTAQPVSLALYDAAGREVARPIGDEVMGAGQHRVVFAAGDLPSGIDLCRLRAGAWKDTRRMAHLR